MTREQEDLVEEARRSMEAATLLLGQGYFGYAASRAYYAMFYVAEAALLSLGLAFSKHGAVHAAFGKHFVKPGLAPREFYRYLSQGMDLRHSGDYGKGPPVSQEAANEQIRRAGAMIDWARKALASS